MVNLSLIGCLNHFKNLSFNSSQNSVLLLFFLNCFLVKQCQCGLPLQCRRTQFLCMSIRDATIISKVLCQCDRWKMGFHDLVCVSLIMRESSTFCIFLGHLYFLFHIFWPFVLPACSRCAMGVIIFLLIHKSFLHMENTFNFKC